MPGGRGRVRRRRARRGTPSASASANASIEVTPSTVEPGTRVDLRADCADGNNRQASAESDAFGRVVLRPGNGALTGSVTVPGNKQPGTYQVNLTCQNGNNASTNLIVVNMSKPSQGPATGGGGTAGGMSGPLVIAGGAAIVAVGVLYLTAGRRRRTGAG
ncbi:hypothetical protein [Micromonospora zhanjiangensis]